MEDQKNNRGLIALLIVIIVILSALCILLATETISFKSNDVNINKPNDNITDNNEENENVNDNNKNDADDNENTSQNSNENNTTTCEECPKCEYTEVDYSSLFNMGSGNIIETATSYNEDGLKLNLYSNGKLYYVKKKESISTQKEIKISNITKVVSYSNPGSGTGPTFYMLNKEGKLYSIDENELINGNVTPKEVTNVPNFVDIGIWNTYKPNAGGGEGVFGITSDGKAHSVIFNSV